MPTQDQTLSYLGDRPVSDLVGEDFAIEWAGTAGRVTGAIHNMTDFTAFDPSTPTGHFFPITLDEQYEDEEITVDNGDGHPKTETDRNWTFRCENVVGNTITISTKDKTIVTLDISGANQEEE